MCNNYTNMNLEIVINHHLVINVCCGILRSRYLPIVVTWVPTRHKLATSPVQRQASTLLHHARLHFVVPVSSQTLVKHGSPRSGQKIQAATLRIFKKGITLTRSHRHHLRRRQVQAFRHESPWPLRSQPALDSVACFGWQNCYRLAY